MTKADLQAFKALLRETIARSRETNDRHAYTWAIAKRVTLAALLVAALAFYYLLSQLHGAFFA